MTDYAKALGDDLDDAKAVMLAARESPRAPDIASRTGIALPEVQRLLDRLVELGLIAKVAE